MNGLVSKRYHEIRDPIHGFITLDRDERRVLDSPPVQRLRDIHQLAMSYLVYPGASHKRFEHSLGVMELASRVFDIVTARHNLHPSVQNTVLHLTDREREYWRAVLKMAALCHDIGHLPFSHAAEKELLPDGISHESLTTKVIQNDAMSEIWDSMTPPLNPKHIAKIAVGRKHMEDEEFSDWEILLSEVIGSDALGADRMDYLLRDSHHAGVAYGRFDHYRLVDSMRVLPSGQLSDEPTLGIASGGIHSSEALLLARYFMFMQVYYHPVRAAYDLHLEEFLKEWLPGGRFPVEVEHMQRLNDNRVLEAVVDAAACPKARGHMHASRIIHRKHFKMVYSPTLSDREANSDPLAAIAEACERRYGDENVRVRSYPPSQAQTDFPVLSSDGSVESSHALSDPLRNIPVVDVKFVLIDPDVASEARQWIRSEKNSILSSQ